ncbi:S-adenosyl-L-methionine-dependent methyltransferase [Umbelopsis sp. AD052]|nr:S-adenosyl-L-methionine-dependent methyltransferase [Umbelopsis sp. AD052]
MPSAVSLRGGKMLQKLINKRMNSDDEDIFFSSSISITSSSRRPGAPPSLLKNARSTPNFPKASMEQTIPMPPRGRSRPNSAESDDITDRYYPSLSHSATSESSSGSSADFNKRPRSVEEVVQWMDDRVLQYPPMRPSTSESVSRDIRVTPKRWNTVTYRARFDDPYALKDSLQEQDRLIAQHYLLRTAFKGDFSAPIRQVLEKGVVVLDVGCGPGTWTMEMSTLFPRSTFIGIDIHENYPKQVKPKNCHFRKCNAVGDQLPFPDNSIGFVFQRDLNWGLQASDWTRLIKEYHRVLKPGGWIELVEPDIETQQSSVKERALYDKIIHVLSCRSQDPFVSRRLSSILATSGFRRVESRFQSLPLGWSGDIGDAYAHCYQQQLQALKGLIGSSTVGDALPSILAEWKEFHAYINWHSAVAQKPWTTRREDATYAFL